MTDDDIMSVNPAHELRRGRPSQGRSGNACGRGSKRSSLNEVVSRQMNASVSVRIDGKPARVPLTAAIVAKTFRDGLTGNPKATEQCLRMIEKFGGQPLSSDPPQLDLSSFSLEETREFIRLLRKTGATTDNDEEPE